MASQNIASGFAFLSLEAGFEISESLVEYNSSNSYGKALLVGLLNTLKVSLIGNGLALILGVGIGIARLSSNWPMAKVAKWYIEVLRNTPLLLQLFFCYTIILEVFPPIRQALNPLPHVYLSQRGFFFPLPESHPGHKWILASILLAIGICYIFYRWNTSYRDRTGKSAPLFWINLATIFLLPFIAWWGVGLPSQLTVPQLKGFNFSGGVCLTPEFLALLAGLTLHTSAFMAEIVRAGILSVKKGQWEAAQSLGLNFSQKMGLVIMPQALRVIIPPITSQLLNLTKNSSLAVAIGHPDFVSVANTSLNQTGQAIELISLIMLVYLIFSLATSLFMNWYNRKMALVER